MTTEQLLHLRQTADRDDSLTTTARLLFGEIINLNVLGDGCYKAYTTLAEDLGLNERTVRRRRKELESAGYLTVSREGDRRYLVPTPPDTSDRTGQQCPDSSVRPDSSDRTEVSAPDTDDETPPDTGDDDKEVYNPAEARESAPAHEVSSEESPDELFSALVDVWRSVGTAPPLTKNTEDVLWGWAQDQTVADVDLFREVLQEQSADTTAKGCGLSTGILLKEYRKQRDASKLEPWQKEDKRYSVDEEGQVCFKGVPLSETGPQNVYDDYERKDGSMRREPEVSPS